ncbi:MAG: response regulator [Spirochaetes bacterium]|nr:response regulator [Spirochaetota bacterium]
MKTIFVVDDNDTSLLAAKAALDGRYKVYALPAAEKMLKLAEKILPDLILLDVVMPEIDGFEAMRRLKADERLKQVPVIFLSGKDDEESEKQGLELGAAGFIHKPFSRLALIEQLEAHL